MQIELAQRNLFGGKSFAPTGSGFVVSADGLVITNAHVVRDGHAELSVKLSSGKSYRGRVLKLDKQADLALIKIETVSSNNIRIAKKKFYLYLSLSL